MRINHDIFRTPHAVELTLEDCPTPPDYRRKDASLGKTMPMWRVQTEGYLEGTDQLIGLVSRDAGFEGPDTEWISSGVNSKSIRGVAIGRHANFLHWGFAASPTYMTDEAKLVFINAVHYIARFAGAQPVIRKIAGTMPRSAVRDAVKGASERGYAETCAFYERMWQQTLEQRKIIRAKMERGEEISEMERRELNYPKAEVPGRFDRVRRYMPKDVQAELGDDYGKIVAWFDANLPYFRPAGWYRLEIDEELRGFGTGSADSRFVEKAVAALGDEERVETAMALLARYTPESFTTKAEWDTWFAENRDRLIYSEVGGYRWFVNGLKAEAVTRAIKLAPTAAEPLVASLSVQSKGAGRFAVTVDIEILEGWHAYDTLPKGAAYTALQLALNLPKGASASAWKRPASHPYVNDLRLNVFEGRIAFHCEVEGAKSADAIACSLTFQVCDESMCMPTTTKVLRAATPAGTSPN